MLAGSFSFLLLGVLTVHVAMVLSFHSSFVWSLLSLQFSVTVSFSVSIRNPKLSIVDKEQGVASKSVRYGPVFGKGWW